MGTKATKMTKKEKKNVIASIKENYIHWEQAIVNQLAMSSQHNLTTGTFREEIWQEMFERIVPRKFSIARSVFIIDSSGEISNEVDLAIFDEQYTPYIFRNGQMKYIPIEAVAVVVQCKSKTVKGVDSWAKSIANLQTSWTGISRMASGVQCGGRDFWDAKGNWNDPDIEIGTTQTATRPLRILCHLGKPVSSRQKEPFDLIIAPDKVSRERLSIEIVPKKESNSESTSKASQQSLLEREIPREQCLGYWFSELNHNDKKIKDRLSKSYWGTNDKLAGLSLEQLKVNERDKDSNEISLLTLTFQLNQLLMIINNPLLFPHEAYAVMFNGVPLPPDGVAVQESTRDGQSYMRRNIRRNIRKNVRRTVRK